MGGFDIVMAGSVCVLLLAYCCLVVFCKYKRLEALNDRLRKEIAKKLNTMYDGSGRQKHDFSFDKKRNKYFCRNTKSCHSVDPNMP